MDDWYWAVHNVEPARQKFIIENGKEALFARAYREFGTDRELAWLPMHRGSKRITTDHVFRLLLTVVPTYRVDHNRFMLEAAKIPIFAQFLRDSPSNLSDYVSNSIYGNALIPLEPYSSASTRRLGSVVSATLGIEDDWYDC